MDLVGRIRIQRSGVRHPRDASGCEYAWGPGVSIRLDRPGREAVALWGYALSRRQHLAGTQRSLAVRSVNQPMDLDGWEPGYRRAGGLRHAGDTGRRKYTRGPSGFGGMDRQFRQPVALRRRVSEFRAKP